MSKVCEITVNVDEALSVNKYEVDEETLHIELAEDDGSEAYDEEFLKLVRVCPAAPYKGRRGRREVVRLRRLPGVRHLPHRLRGHHRQEVGQPRPDDGRRVPLRLASAPYRSAASG